jgi:hypothetical protein
MAQAHPGSPALGPFPTQSPGLRHAPRRSLLLLNSGMPATEFGRAAVLFEIYACCFGGQASAVTERITCAHANPDVQTGLGGEEHDCPEPWA